MKLIQYLPPRLKEIKELADFQEAIQPYIDEMGNKCDQLLKNKNPLYADLDGIIRWEEWLHITPDGSKTLEQRRIDIIAKLNERLPFTIVQLYRILIGVVGSDTLEIVTYPGEPKIDIEFDISQRDAGGSIGGLLKRIIPAHVQYKVRNIYNIKEENVRVYSTGHDRDIIEIPLNEEKEIATVKMNKPYLHKEIIEVGNG